jgi:4-amino-4-deoxy-L-arabinose transferase-like glycosyltransferase
MAMIRNLFAGEPSVRWIRRVVLLALLMFALALRLWGAFFDLPYIYHPDEPIHIDVIQAMYTTGNPNPHYFQYPTLFYYLNALAACIYFGVPSAISGSPWLLMPPTNLVMGTTYAIDADAVALFRSLTICAGVLSVFLVYLIGSRAQGIRTGLIAAALMAISPLLVADCRHVTPDTFVVVFVLLTILASLSVAESGRWGIYAVAGVAVGAAAASKYNGALAGLCVVAAHFLRFGFTPKQWGRLALAGVTSMLAFFVCSPFVVLDFRSALADITYQFHHYSGEHAGMDGNAPLWYLGELWVGTGIAAALSVAQIARLGRHRSPLSVVLAGFAIGYMLFISTFGIRNDRTLLPVIPCVLLLAAMFVVDFGSWLQSAKHGISPMLGRVLLVALGLALMISPLRLALQQTLQLTTVDSRATAREWINTVLPPNSLVAIESYSPFVDPSRFRLVKSERAIDHELDWYLDQGVDYVILNQPMFGRYFAHPPQYPEEVALYQHLMDSLTLVKRFDDGGYVVDIYRTPFAAEQRHLN